MNASLRFGDLFAVRERYTGLSKTSGTPYSDWEKEWGEQAAWFLIGTTGSVDAANLDPEHFFDAIRSWFFEKYHNRYEPPTLTLVWFALGTLLARPHPAPRSADLDQVPENPEAIRLFPRTLLLDLLHAYETDAVLMHLIQAPGRWAELVRSHDAEFTIAREHYHFLRQRLTDLLHEDAHGAR